MAIDLYPLQVQLFRVFPLEHNIKGKDKVTGASRDAASVSQREQSGAQLHYMSQGPLGG